MKNGLLLLVLLCLLSCVENNRNDEVESINFDKIVDVKLEELISIDGAIKLDEVDEALFRTVSQMKVINNKLYILDMSLNKIFCFGIDGSFEKVLSKSGQGPGEYAQLTSFDVDLSSGKLIVTDSDIKTLIYNLNTFEFIQELDKTIGYSICVHNDRYVGFNYLMLIRESRSYNDYIIIADSLLNVINNVLPIEYETGYIMFPSSRFYKHNKELLTFTPFDNKIYEFRDDSFIPKYSLFFGNNTVYNPKVLKNKDAGYNYLRDLKNSKYVWSVNPIEVDNSLIVGYRCGNTSYLGLYDKNNKSTICYEFKNMSESSLFSNIQHLNFNNIITVVSSNVLSNINMLGYDEQDVDSEGYYIVRLKVL